MKKMVLAISVGMLINGSLISQVQAFGPLGHRIIGQIAENNLTSDAKQAIDSISNGKSLAQLSTWADEIRSDKNWYHAGPWHYVSIADDETWQTVKRSDKGDIIAKLEDFERALSNPQLDATKKLEALAFYVHFVGDIHQPLHVGHSHDKGGNAITVKWFGEQTNLHSVWDSKILNHQELSYTEYSKFLSHFNADDVKSWQGKNYYQWADESKSLRESTYQFEKNRDGEDDLRFNYVFIHKPVIEKRVQQAGVRLAEKLNLILAK